MSKFSDGTTEGYAELPVPFAWLKWTRGDAKLKAIAKTDPGAYFGGWRAFVTSTDRTTQEAHDNPVLPLPIVERVSEDGKHPYNVYASNVIEFLPIQHRTRFELRETVKDEQTGREYKKVVAISKDRREGYSPCRQIFGLVFMNDKYSPAVISLDAWSNFISFEKAGQKWNKVVTPANQALVRRYGSVGVKDDKGNISPRFEVFGQGRSTPIEAIGLSKPRFIEITPELDELYENSIAWKNCSKWNADGKVEADPEIDTALTKFLSVAEDLGLTNVEIEQLVKENNGDYHMALKAISAPEVDDINEAFGITDNPQ